uniref:Uncharacterized protein n=1 Tax=Caenorhabditis japonica TaxID=281687 RepID=A0A8R1ELQ7_CAEJA
MFTVDHMNVFKTVPSIRRRRMLHYIDSSESEDENLVDELPVVIRRVPPNRYNMSRAISTNNLKHTFTSTSSEALARRASCFELNKEDEFKLMAADKLLKAMDNMRKASENGKWTSTESLPGLVKNRRKGPLNVLQNLMGGGGKRTRGFMVGPPTLISSTVSLHEITVS